MNKKLYGKLTNLLKDTNSQIEKLEEMSANSKNLLSDCPAEQIDLLAKIEKYITSVKSFNGQIKKNTDVFKIYLFKSFTEAKTKENFYQKTKKEIKDLTKALSAIGKELERANEEISLHKKKTEELDKLKDELIGTAAHDLRNPISAILSFSEILKEGYAGELNNEQKEMIQIIIGASQNMINLINDLLDINKIESGKLNLVYQQNNLADLLNEAVKFNSIIALRKGISLTLDLPKELPSIELDKERIKQVLDNIISNAIKFSYPDTQVLISAAKKNVTIEISIKDQGQGISEKEMKQLFGKFQQLSSKATGGEKGTGLGLAIAKKIVELHDGKIKVKSKLGEGTIFTISLPIKRPPEINSPPNF